MIRTFIFLLLFYINSQPIFSQAGEVDTLFNNGDNGTGQLWGGNNTTTAIAKIQEDRFLVGGSFTEFSGIKSQYFALIDSLGNLVQAFSNSFQFKTEPVINDIVRLDNGKILVGGAFKMLKNGFNYNNLMRLNQDYSIDTTFKAESVSETNKIMIINNNSYLPLGDVLSDGFSGGFIKFDSLGIRSKWLFSNANVLSVTNAKNFIKINDNEFIIDADIGYILGALSFEKSSVIKIKDGAIDPIFDDNFNLSNPEISSFSDNIFVLENGGFYLHEYYGGKLQKYNFNGEVVSSYYGVYVPYNTSSIIIKGDWLYAIGSNYAFPYFLSVYRINIITGIIDDSFSRRPLLNGGDLVSINDKFYALGRSPGIVKFNNNGVLDINFGKVVNGMKYEVKGISVLPDERIFINSQFSYSDFNTVYHGQTVRNPVLISKYGDIDPTFKLDYDIRILDLKLNKEGEIFVLLTTGKLHRINPNGSIDTTFNCHYTGSIYGFKITTNGNFFIQGQDYLVSKLTKNGQIDSSFNPLNLSEFYIDSKERILFKDQWSYFHRLLPNGLEDTTFNFETSVWGGKILDNGNNQYLVFPWSSGLMRLNVDGSRDLTFKSGLNSSASAINVKMQNDGKLLVSNYGTPSLVRLLNNGQIDSTFSVSDSFSSIKVFDFIGDEGLIIGGVFNSYKNVARSNISKLFLGPQDSCSSLDLHVARHDPLNCNLEGQLHMLLNGASFPAIINGGVQIIDDKNFTILYDSLQYIDILAIDNRGCSDSISILTSTQKKIDSSEIFLHMVTAAYVRGFETEVKLFLSNKGCLVEKGSLKFIVPKNLEFIKSNPAPFEIIDDTLFWKIDELTDTQDQIISLSLKTDLSAIIDDDILLCLEFNSSSSTNLTSHYIKKLKSKVVGSFDPNDISLIPIGACFENEKRIDEDFIYTIRFENLGNYFARNVYINSEIDSNFSINDIEVLGSSHSMFVEKLSSRKLRFSFEEIILPGIGDNDKSNSGFVIYKLKNTSKLSVGDMIQSQANIIFDYNDPIITNKNIVTLVNDYIVNAAIKLDENTLISLNDNEIISWYDCDTNLKIDNEDSNTFNVIESGNYGLIVSYGNCIDTSDCINVVISGNLNVTASSGLLLFPNPAKDILRIQGDKIIRNIKIRNIIGGLLIELKNSTNYIEIDLSSINNSVLMFEIALNDGTILFERVLKQP